MKIQQFRNGQPEAVTEYASPEDAILALDLKETETRESEHERVSRVSPTELRVYASSGDRLLWMAVP